MKLKFRCQGCGRPKGQRSQLQLARREKRCKVSLNGGGHRTVIKTRILRTVPVQGHGDDPGVMVMTLLSHSITFCILSPHKFNDVAGNLMLMTLS
jgi:hypothetical protein